MIPNKIPINALPKSRFSQNGHLRGSEEVSTLVHEVHKRTSTFLTAKNRLRKIRRFICFGTTILLAAMLTFSQLQLETRQREHLVVKRKLEKKNLQI